MWREIRTGADADALMAAFGGFHDSCVHSMRYVSGTYVNGKLAMGDDRRRELSVVFQRQWEAPAAIEMEFSGLAGLRLKPDAEFGDIIGAALTVRDGLVYFGDDINAPPDAGAEGTSCWICAKAARWRAVELREDGDSCAHAPYVIGPPVKME